MLCIITINLVAFSGWLYAKFISSFSIIFTMVYGYTQYSGV